MKPTKIGVSSPSSPILPMFPQAENQGDEALRVKRPATPEPAEEFIPEVKVMALSEAEYNAALFEESEQETEAWYLEKISRRRHPCPSDKAALVRFFGFFTAPYPTAYGAFPEPRARTTPPPATVSTPTVAQRQSLIFESIPLVESRESSPRPESETASSRPIIRVNDNFSVPAFEVNPLWKSFDADSHEHLETERNNSPI